MSGPDGGKRELACDDVVVASGVRSRTVEAESFVGLAPQTFIVGDCRRARIIKDAVFEGYSAAAHL